VAQRSRRRKEHYIYPIFYQLPSYLRRALADERPGVVNCAHKAKVAMVHPSHDALLHQPPEGPQRDDGIEVVAPVWGVVCVGPREGLRLGRDLTVRAVAQGVVYVEAGLLGQVDPAGRDEREPAFVKGLFGADEGEHGPRR
jgi:hypothetical protein